MDLRRMNQTGTDLRDAVMALGQVIKDLPRDKEPLAVVLGYFDAYFGRIKGQGNAYHTMLQEVYEKYQTCEALDVAERASRA